MKTQALTRPLAVGFLGAAVRRMRDERGLSARELSLRAGLSESYVGKLEAGKIDPSLRAFGKLVVALNLSCAEVYFLAVEAGRSSTTVTGAE